MLELQAGPCLLVNHDQHLLYMHTVNICPEWFSMLASCLQEFRSADDAREAAFRAAETALQQGASEKELDQRTQMCLDSLDKYADPDSHAYTGCEAA